MEHIKELSILSISSKGLMLVRIITNLDEKKLILHDEMDEKQKRFIDDVIRRTNERYPGFPAIEDIFIKDTGEFRIWRLMANQFDDSDSCKEFLKGAEKTY